MEIGPVHNVEMWISVIELFAIGDNVVLPDHQLARYASLVSFTTLAWFIYALFMLFMAFLFSDLIAGGNFFQGI